MLLGQVPNTQGLGVMVVSLVIITIYMGNKILKIIIIKVFKAPGSFVYETQPIIF